MIRPAKSDDLPALVVLLEQLFSIEKDFTFDAAKQVKGLELLIESETGHIAVAEIGGRVAGMATGQLLVSTAEGGVALLVEDLVVAPSLQGNGLGPDLLQAVGDWGRLHGAKRMQLLADKENSRAIAFYQNQQWQKTQLICLRKYHKE